MKMKYANHIIVSMLSILLAIVSGCQSQQTALTAVTCDNPCESGHPKIVFASTEHNFGKVAAGAKKTCSFDFINDGKKDLVIEKIHASCGCTTTMAQNTTLKPGQASEIEVTYKASSSGKSKKRVMVYTNDPENSQIALWISTEVSGQTKNAKTIATKSAIPPTEKRQSPKDTIPKGLKQTLQNLNKATGG